VLPIEAWQPQERSGNAVTKSPPPVPFAIVEEERENKGGGGLLNFWH